MSPKVTSHVQRHVPFAQSERSGELTEAVEVILVSLGKNLDAIDLGGDKFEITHELRQLLNEIRTLLR